ncbi:hypothetical protein K5962_28465, partial [Klebsiella pneumoniae]|uniref:hypothetical protein n=1 Tax=Klebsiella pneumoniae TaxID=573 RepID=UPI001C8C4977
QWQARFGGPFLYKKSLHGFMQARQLCLDPVPVYGFFGRKLKNTVSITFCKQWIQIPRPCICVAFFYFRLAGVIIDTARC